VHDAFCVQIPDSQCDLEGVEFDHLLRQTLVRFENFVKLSTSDEWHDEVESLLSLE
jgi:hypothetical protein